MPLVDAGFRILLAVAYAIVASIALAVLVPVAGLIVTPAYGALGVGPLVVGFALLVLVTFHQSALAAFWRTWQTERQRRGLR